MQNYISYNQILNKSNIYDIYQNIIDCYIKSNFFPWVCLILILNKNNLKRPVILILIAHWFLRSTGDLLRNTMDLRPKSERNWYWPYNRKNWYISNAIAHIFWLSGEIVADWYPLLRTRAVTNNSRKMRMVYITCIIYNLVKVFGIYCYFMNNPIDLSQKSVPDGFGGYKTVSGPHLAAFNIAWWSTISVMQIASIFYDISVIISLRKCLFNKINAYQIGSKKTFMDKFKQISELRIVFSTVASMIFLPFVITFVIYVLLDKTGKLKTNITYDDEKAIEQIRQVVLSINYNLMYIDQILLKYYAKPSIKYNKINSNNPNNKDNNNKNKYKNNYYYYKHKDKEISTNNQYKNINEIDKPSVIYNNNIYNESLTLNNSLSNSSSSYLLNNPTQSFLPVKNNSINQFNNWDRSYNINLSYYLNS